MDEGFHNKLQKALKEVSIILDRLSVCWFLLGGTCLGFVRNRRFIEHDTDIDIGILIPQKEVKKLLTALPKSKKVYFFNGDISEITLDFGVRVDIFLIFNYSGFVVETLHNTQQNLVRLLGYDEKIISNGTRREEFENVNVNILKESNMYCKTVYGEGYMLIEKNYSWWNSPRNIIFEGFYSYHQLHHDDEKRTSFNEDIATSFLECLSRQILNSTNLISSDHSLVTGKGGAALFFYLLFQLTNNSFHLQIAREIIIYISEQLYYSMSFSFSYGICGIAWLSVIFIDNGVLNVEKETALLPVDCLIKERANFECNSFENLMDIIGFVFYYSEYKPVTNKDKSELEIFKNAIRKLIDIYNCCLDDLTLLTKNDDSKFRMTFFLLTLFFNYLKEKSIEDFKVIDKYIKKEHLNQKIKRLFDVYDAKKITLDVPQLKKRLEILISYQLFLNIFNLSKDLVAKNKIHHLINEVQNFGDDVCEWLKKGEQNIESYLQLYILTKQLINMTGDPTKQSFFIILNTQLKNILRTIKYFENMSIIEEPDILKNLYNKVGFILLSHKRTESIPFWCWLINYHQKHNVNNTLSLK